MSDAEVWSRWLAEANDAGIAGRQIPLAPNQKMRIIQLLKDRIQERLRLTMPNPPAAAPPLPVVPAVRLPIVETLLNVSNSTLHEDMKREMRTWSNPPTAIQVLSVWDKAREGGFANYAALEALDRLYNDRAKAEIVALAAEEE